MRTLVVVNNIPTPYRSDLFRRMYCLAREYGYSMSVVYLAQSESIRAGWNADLEPYETILPIVFQGRIASTTTSDLIINRNYLRLLAGFDTALFFGYSYPSIITSAAHRRLRRQPNILFCESTLVESKTSAPYRIGKVALLKLFDLYMTPGRRSKEYLEAIGVAPERIGIAPNASALTPSCPSTQATQTGMLRLLYVGRIAPEKRLISFVQYLRVTEQSFTMSIAGSGPEADTLRSIVGDDKRFTLLGSVPNSKLSAVYQAHDVLVLPSESETWGFVVSEAVNHGLSLLLSDRIGCAPELLVDNGCLLKAITPEDISCALSELRTNLNNFKAASAQLSRKFTVDSQAHALLACASKFSNLARP